MEVLSLVSAEVATDRHEEVGAAYAAGVEAGLPPGLRATYLLADGETLAVASLWESAEVLEAMRGSGEEPFARRILREAGGEPVARFFQVRATAAQR